MSYIGRFQSQLKTLREANPENSIQEAFSFCFVEGGGYMILGGYDSENNLSPMCFTPFSSLNRYYRVAFSAVSFDAQRAYYLIDKWNANAGVMIDSGTTFTYLISSEYRVFTQAFVEALRQSLNKAHATLPPVKRFRVPVVLKRVMHRNTTVTVWPVQNKWRCSPHCGLRCHRAVPSWWTRITTCTKWRAMCGAWACIATPQR